MGRNLVITEAAPAKILLGHVMHERVRPVRHRFVYPVFYLRVNLARLHELNSAWFGINRWRAASLHIKDYGPRDGSDLETWMRNLLQREGVQADGEIWLQTFPRLFGFVFNPVSFWYCYDQSGTLQAVLAEVNNTFGESHCYLLTDMDSDAATIAAKHMHVSPFCEVKGHYRFKFRDVDNASLVSLNYHDEVGLLIKTTLGGKSFAFTTRRIRNAVLRQPFLTLGIVLGIHWQAFKLWRKGVQFFSKPAAPKHILTMSIASQPLTHQEESIS